VPRLTETGWIYVVADAGRAGSALNTLLIVAELPRSIQSQRTGGFLCEDSYAHPRRTGWRDKLAARQAKFTSTAHGDEMRRYFHGRRSRRI
jgi:hypothetical protein